MRKKVTLVTGAAGEVGHSLVRRLANNGAEYLLTLDIRPLPEDLDGMSTHIVGDVLDTKLFSRLVSEYEFDKIFHLAALLSTKAEFSPETAHRVNVEGTMALLQLAADQSDWRGESVKFIFPSSIAVYGMPNLETKRRFSRVREWEWNYPTSMYGCNKLYGEMLGRYFSENYRQLAMEVHTKLDFRSLRYPGLISAFTIPSGGTSDYASEMIHAAAQGLPYECFVHEELAIPFMVMPDAVEAILKLSQAPLKTLNHKVYNVGAFSLTAAQIRDLVLEAFPGARITFKPDEKRQAIAESWPIDLDDSAARRNWGWKPQYDARRAFTEYLIPNIARHYASLKV